MFEIEKMQGYINIEKIKMKNIYLRDIERCPYASTEPDYSYWIDKDNERLARLSEGRTDLANKCTAYLSHEDRFVRQMAMFLDWFLEK